MSIYRAHSGKWIADVDSYGFSLLVGTLPNGVYEIWEGEKFEGHISIVNGRIRENTVA